MKVLDRKSRVPRTVEAQPHPGRRLTEREFMAWVGEKTRAEWVDGEVQIMPPVTDEHDQVVNWLIRVLGLYVEVKGLGLVKGPEFLVRLPRQARRRLPDVIFVAEPRRSIVRNTHVEGPPDLIVEIVSAESASRDWRDKYFEYEKAGVREYWIVDREARRMEAYSLVPRSGYRRIEEVDGKVRSSAIKGFFVEPKWLLGERLPAAMTVLRELGIKA